MNTERVKESLRKYFFDAKIGKNVFYNLIGSKEWTKNLLDELVAEKCSDSFCVRLKLDSVSGDYSPGERYALVWKQIVDKLAEVVSEDVIAEFFDSEENQDAMYDHWVNDYKRASEDFDPDEILQGILDAYQSFAEMDEAMKSSEAIAADVNVWIHDILMGYDAFRLPVLLIIEDFDRAVEIFPREEGYGAFFSKLFTLSPKDACTMPKPSPMGIMVVSETDADMLAHSMGGSSFSAAYAPIGDI